MTLVLKEKVLSFVKAKGPVLPMQVTKEIDRDSFFSGAILSELVANKLIKISHAKIGSSPVYYVPGQEEKLSILADSFPMREKEAYNLLKEKKILHDAAVNPGIRVALRMIRDFAIPQTTIKDGKQELIWKWYLLSDQERKQVPSTQATPLQAATIPPPRQTVLKQEPFRPKQKSVPQKIDFLQHIAAYIRQSNIRILEETMVRKNREFDLIVAIPSNIGDMEFVINAKNKKRLTEADLTLAYQKGQARKLPVILLTNGELTKKAKLYREKNLKGYVLIKQV